MENPFLKNTVKSIIIGCDDTTHLISIIGNLRNAFAFPLNITSAGRSSDLAEIIRKLNTDLVVLFFNNNQLALNDFVKFTGNLSVPILCLLKKTDNEADYFLYNEDSIVFSYPFESINNSNYLKSRINSIFLLGNKTEAPAPAITYTRIKNHSIENPNDLSRYVMELDQKVEVLTKIKKRISHLYPQVDDPTRAELNSIVSAIKMSSNDTALWEDFKLYFEQDNPGFLFILAQKHPELTPKDLKYCCYLKMNMTNDDIRALLGINQESVRTHKYRLKKKMALPKEQDLRGYLHSVAKSHTA